VLGLRQGTQAPLGLGVEIVAQMLRAVRMAQPVEALAELPDRCVPDGRVCMALTFDKSSY
jgi:hypothetical protein